MPNSRPASCASLQEERPRTRSKSAGVELVAGPADLSDHWRGNQWNDAELQTGLVFRPRPPLISTGGHENGGGVDDGRRAGHAPAPPPFSWPPVEMSGG